MISTNYETKLVPFSKRTIMENRLHLVDEDGLGGSTITMLLSGEIEARMPQQMAVAYFNGEPIGVGIVCLIQPGDYFMLAYDDERDDILHGFVNIYVKEAYRCKGIGAMLLDLAVRDFKQTHPGVPRLMISHVLSGKLRQYDGVEPVFARLGQSGRVVLLHRVVRRSLIHGYERYS